MVVKKGTSVEAGIWEVLVEVNAAYTGNPAYAPRTDPLKLIAPPGKKLVDKDGQDIGDVDAWFLSPAAIEKFVLPYYTITRGAEFAKNLRDGYYANEKYVALVHEPDSLPSEVMEADLLKVVKRQEDGTLELLSMKDFFMAMNPGS
ncbi:hypothetical protein GAU_2986 [Gemmatimonas aurantiaca T-27]|uniref:Uncharacterized protein n=2 Tax=Gemmatimonas aurantiaca TaxID=173480 RepID=C1AC01_GEMAT|nr:hypothetical protein GAU_2986 [Gemmatimonas aurantiaca T-27]